MKHLCVTISWGELDVETDEREYSVQYHNGVIPAVGSSFSIWTSRDEDGNYRRDGDCRELVNGIVSSVKYTYEDSGNDSSSWGESMYVVVELEPSKMGDAWE